MKVVEYEGISYLFGFHELNFSLFYHEILSGKFIKIFPLFFGFLFMAFHFFVYCPSSTVAADHGCGKNMRMRLKIESESVRRWKFFLSLNPHHHRRHHCETNSFQARTFGAGTSPVVRLEGFIPLCFMLLYNNSY